MIAFTVLTLTSCGSLKQIHSDYSRPEKSIDSNKIVRADVIDNTDSVKTVSWREMFTDSNLQALIEEGLRNNADLQVAKLKIDEAQASFSAAKKATLPSVDVAATGNISSYDGSKATKTYSIGPEISWEADIFGKLSNAKKMQAASVEESQAYAQAVQTQLIATIAEDYYSLLMYDEQIRVTEQTIESWKEYIKTEEALMNAGQADRSDISQAEASLLSSEATLAALKQSFIEMENSLSSLIGRTSGNIERSALDEQQLPDTPHGGVSIESLANRPDVRESEAQLKQAYYATNKARSAFYPSLTLSGSAGWTNSGGAAITNPGKILLQAAASLTQPIFNKGQNTANLKIAEAQQQETLVNWKQSILDAGKEVNNALSKWQTTSKKVELESMQIDKLKKTLHDEEANMRYGSTNYLQVVVARQSLLSAQLSQLSDRYSQLASVVELYQALGGGVK